MTKVKFSIITPSYNSGKYIEHTIKSIMNQSFESFEHIIVDGGSHDNTMAILKKYTHLKILQGKDNGMYDAINKGIKFAKGDYLCYLNADDLFFPKTLELVNEYSNKFSTSLLFYGNCEFINSKGEKIYEYKLSDLSPQRYLSLRRMYLWQQSTFWKKEAHEIIGYFDSSFKYSGDHDFFKKLFMQDQNVFIDETLAQFRLHKEALSSKYKIEHNNERTKVLDKWDYKLSVFDKLIGSIYDHTYIKLYLNGKNIIKKKLFNDIY